MSAIASVFCPKKQTPLNDIENDLVRVSEGVSNVERIVKTISSKNFEKGSFDSAIAVLESQSEKVDKITKSVLEELSKIEKKKCFGVSIDSQRFYTIALSSVDTIMVISGLALALFAHDNRERVIAGSLAGIGQIASKINDTMASRRERELTRHAILKEYLFSVGSMESSVNSMRTCLSLVSPSSQEDDTDGGNVIFPLINGFVEYSKNIHFSGNGNGNGNGRRIFSHEPGLSSRVDIPPEPAPRRTVVTLGEDEEEVLYDVPPIRLEKPPRADGVEFDV